ncbi:uncharacterized protein LACBIDRAFT_312559 [Laccaria bicolor S238N-H82]|uniref:Predicted protein n=1 Tax=Laccaria bicolor (strain S238N-H82 / ATCC MYA-4686) TaxID=486041 RepID=B0DWE3_LACBS|nr:uncharacterized protein LACBIDRAFT_312559 [Laccaria bicolor S238N-H82]EDR01032.1 predicted protein [Laccaria bicolor S238N-H82]|eukprot:XP_001888251.1 predicted protein [Laccaria bicolor S238N-H82]
MKQGHHFDSEEFEGVVLLVTEKPHRSPTLGPSRLIQLQDSNPCSMETSNTLRELDFDRMFSEGACPAVHRSTASPSLVNPKRSTSPRPLSVYRRATVRSGAVR